MSLRKLKFKILMWFLILCNKYYREPPNKQNPQTNHKQMHWNFERSYSLVIKIQLAKQIF